ncbi:MAG: hypothetical protein V3S62_01925 [Acidimicrobiia bacterium]
MRWLWYRLPGPRPIRILSAILIVAIGLIALHFIYEWMGTTLLDTGGSIG